MPPVTPNTRYLRVVVVRHGPAETRDPARWPDDDLRPLTPKGLKDTRKAARGIADLLDSAPVIATSSAERARATAEVVRSALGSKRRIEAWEELASGRMAEPIFARLERSARPGKAFVLVGHEPTLAEFVGLALTGDGLPLVELSKGGAACLEFPAAVRPGAARLLWLLTRRQLEAIGD